jgi:hypothetical protein
LQKQVNDNHVLPLLPLQVLGHTKTILVLLISWLALGEAMSGRKAAGMAVAVGGMVGYGYCVSGSSSASSSSSSNASRKISKPGGISGAAGAADAMELGKQQQGGSTSTETAGGDEEAAQAESLPLLRNVSRDHAGWAGESVVVLAVQQQSGDGSISSRGAH